MVRSKIAAAVFALTVATGGAAAGFTAMHRQTWVLTAELAFLSLAALAYTFGFRPRLPAWAWSRPFRGVVAMSLGLLVVYVPLQFIVSAYLMGVGARMLWLSTCEEAKEGTGTAVARSAGVDIMERQNGQMARMP